MDQQPSTSPAPPQSLASEPAWRGADAKAEDTVAQLNATQPAEVGQPVSPIAANAPTAAQGFLNSQVAAGAELADHVAEAVRRAANKLEPDAPQIANLVRQAADGAKRLSRDMRNKS